MASIISGRFIENSLLLRDQFRCTTRCVEIYFDTHPFCTPYLVRVKFRCGRHTNCEDYRFDSYDAAQKFFLLNVSFLYLPAGYEFVLKKSILPSGLEDPNLQ